MDDAYQEGNLQEVEGQPIQDNVGQDVGGNSTESSQEATEQESSRYHQSRADKLASENEKLKKYEKLGQMLETRPDLVQGMMAQLGGGGKPASEERIEISQDEFDPWEAFNDPKSKSYQYREQQDNQRIETIVQERMGGLQKNIAKTQLQNEVVNSGLISREEAPAFMQFALSHPSKLGLQNVIKMFRAVNAGDPATQAPNPLDQVRQNQQAPTPAGILNGEQPQQKSEVDDVWDSIVKAGGRTNVLK